MSEQKTLVRVDILVDLQDKLLSAAEKAKPCLSQEGDLLSIAWVESGAAKNSWVLRGKGLTKEGKKLEWLVPVEESEARKVLGGMAQKGKQTDMKEGLFHQGKELLFEKLLKENNKEIKVVHDLGEAQMLSSDEGVWLVVNSDKGKVDREKLVDELAELLDPVEIGDAGEIGEVATVLSLFNRQSIDVQAGLWKLSEKEKGILQGLFDRKISVGGEGRLMQVQELLKQRRVGQINMVLSDVEYLVEMKEVQEQVKIDSDKIADLDDKTKELLDRYDETGEIKDDVWRDIVMLYAFKWLKNKESKIYGEVVGDLKIVIKDINERWRRLKKLQDSVAVVEAWMDGKAKGDKSVETDSLEPAVTNILNNMSKQKIKDLPNLSKGMSLTTLALEVIYRWEDEEVVFTEAGKEMRRLLELAINTDPEERKKKSEVRKNAVFNQVYKSVYRNFQSKDLKKWWESEAKQGKEIGFIGDEFIKVWSGWETADTETKKKLINSFGGNVLVRIMTSEREEMNDYLDRVLSVGKMNLKNQLQDLDRRINYKKGLLSEWRVIVSKLMMDKGGSFESIAETLKKMNKTTKRKGWWEKVGEDVKILREMWREMGWGSSAGNLRQLIKELATLRRDALSLEEKDRLLSRNRVNIKKDLRRKVRVCK